MTVPRFLAIVSIFVLAAISWVVLGGSVQMRTNSSTSELGERIEGLWGSSQAQNAPLFTGTAKGTAITLPIASSAIKADFNLDQRRKGLLWYATYAVDFDATYQVSNPASASVDTQMAFTFPVYDGVYDGFAVDVDGEGVPVTYTDGVAYATFDLGAGETAVVHTCYRTQGLDEWRYVPTPDGVSVIDDFSLAMTTDFADVDYPADAVSPTNVQRSDTGMFLSWDYDSLVTGRAIGLIMPKPANPGELVSRISFFAPVSLLFYFAALILLTVTNGARLHPMHYGFLAAGFFAFHLLLAYLADHININVAFGIASLTSVALCVGYLRIVLGKSKALLEIAVSQFIFLVLFSYSFFFAGFTGLAVTIGAVVTLGYFMLKTGNVDWEQAFARKQRDPRML